MSYVLTPTLDGFEVKDKPPMFIIYTPGSIRADGLATDRVA